MSRPDPEILCATDESAPVAPARPGRNAATARAPSSRRRPPPSFLRRRRSKRIAPKSGRPARRSAPQLLLPAPPEPTHEAVPKLGARIASVPTIWREPEAESPTETAAATLPASSRRPPSEPEKPAREKSAAPRKRKIKAPKLTLLDPPEAPVDESASKTERDGETAFEAGLLTVIRSVRSPRAARTVDVKAEPLDVDPIDETADEDAFNLFDAPIETFGQAQADDAQETPANIEDAAPADDASDASIVDAGRDAAEADAAERDHAENEPCGPAKGVAEPAAPRIEAAQEEATGLATAPVAVAEDVAAKGADAEADASEEPRPAPLELDDPLPPETAAPPRRNRFATLRSAVRRRGADALVASLALIAAAAPWLAPQTRAYNPFLDKLHVRAERSVIVLPDDAPTLWTGLREARAERAILSAWSMDLQGRPMNVGLALSTPATLVEVDPAPLPALAAVGQEISGKPALPPGAAITLDEEQLAWAEIETASIDEDAVEGVDPLAPPPVQIAPPEAAPRPSGRPEIDPVAVRPGAGYVAVDEPERQEPYESAADLGEESYRETAQETAYEPQSVSYEAEPARDNGAGPARVSIVLTAVGLNEAASQMALYTLPPEVAVAVAPVGDRPSDWARAAHQSGRVVLVEVPMEPSSYPRVNPGPLTLLTSSTGEENRRRLEAALAEMPDIDGVSTYLGDRFKTDRDALAPILSELKGRGLYVFENDRKGSSALVDAARKSGVSALASSVSLDKGGRRRDISEGLEKLETEARKTGSAIGVAVALPGTVKALADWLETAEGRGLQLVALHP